MKTLIKCVLSLSLGMGVVSSHAASVCEPATQGTAFLYFNGVNTTFVKAVSSTEKLKEIYGIQDANGRDIVYDLMYNPTEGFGDFAEVFDQRLSEQSDELNGRFELFFEALNGDGELLEQLSRVLPRAIEVRDEFSEYLRAAIPASITSLQQTAPNEVLTGFRTRIDAHDIEGRRLLMLAHSQGNLFLNPSYDYAVSKISPSSVGAVQVAPASSTLRGNHILADLDLVINALRLVGDVPNNNVTIPAIRPAGLNGKKDFLGHGLLEIYLNNQLPEQMSPRKLIDAEVNRLLSSLEYRFTDAESNSAFFTVTLTWDGAGDVDLHTFEPDGRQVFYRNPRGNSGFLDVDNTVANGPEHYYATCEDSLLQRGVYEVKLANFSRAEGRIATVQLSSQRNGVLSTRRINMGPATGDEPTLGVFGINVENRNGVPVATITASVN